MSNALDVMSHAGSHIGWGFGNPGPWWIVFPLILLGLVVTVVWLIARRPGRLRVRENTAVDILAARYARGEIDTDEYRHRLDEIRGLSR